MHSQDQKKKISNNASFFVGPCLVKGGGVGDVSHVHDPFFCGVVLSVKVWQDSHRSVFLSKLWGFYDVVGVLCCMGAQGPAP